VGDIIQESRATSSHYTRATSSESAYLTILDRFGQPVKPKEWFLVPLQVIDEAVEKIRDGSITEFSYDPHTAKLAKAVV
jgi:hypothetical protein